jgi:hypothetical protein
MSEVVMTESQNTAIRNHLRNGDSITPLDALFLFGCLRLSARIKDLRDKGEPIQMQMVKDGKKHYARYFIAVENLGT